MYIYNVSDAIKARGLVQCTLGVLVYEEIVIHLWRMSAAPTRPSHNAKAAQKTRFLPSPTGGRHTRKSLRKSRDEGSWFVTV